MKLSIIIPVYNVENYIGQCIKSIIQSIENYGKKEDVELVIVDDESLDNSIRVVTNILSNTSIFYKIYHKKNGGISDARNYGIKKAQGEYISFIDSDDFVTIRYIENIMDSLSKNTDLLVFDFYNFYSKGDYKVIKGLDLSQELWTCNPSVCNKVFKKVLFETIEFPLGRIYEDVEVSYKINSIITSWSYIPQSIYFYRKNRPGSYLTQKQSKKDLDDIYLVLTEVFNFNKKNLNNKEISNGLEYQYIKLLLWSNMYRQLKFYKFNIFGFYKEMKKNKLFIEERFNNWSENSLIELNENFFINRFGKKYLKVMDNIGCNFFSNLLYITYIIIINLTRR